jgi:hypothetical protein
MKLKLMVASIGIGALLLTGCGGGDSDGIKDKLLGTWYSYYSDEGPCIDYEHGTSDIQIVDIADKSIEVITKHFSELGCHEEDMDDKDSLAFSYTVGAETTGSKGEDAYEIDMTLTKNSSASDDDMLEKTMYGMFRLDGDKLFFTDIEHGTSKDTREDKFSEKDYMKKK